jgi:hypothetical protein
MNIGLCHSLTINGVNMNSAMLSTESKFALDYKRVVGVNSLSTTFQLYRGGKKKKTK